MSQGSSQGSESLSQILSQETYNSLQAYVEEAIHNNDFSSQYQVSPYNVALAEENAQENLQINIERYATTRTADLPIQGFLHNNIPPSFEPHSFPTTSSPPISHASTSPCNGNQLPDGHLVCKQEYLAGRNDVITPPPDLPPLQCIVPSNTNFSGSYNFDIEFEEEAGPPAKSSPWTFSKQMKKLFIKMRCLVPVRFLIRGPVPPPPGCYIRSQVVFTQPEHYREVAERCLNHIMQQKDGHQSPKHLLRCENIHTHYETCRQTGRHMTIMPVRQNEAGADYYTEMLQFMCFNSCTGGMNRRPCYAIFTLEHQGVVIGRRVLNVRICSCPGRDRGDQELVDTKKKSAISEAGEPSSTPTPPDTPSADPVSPTDQPSGVETLNPKPSGKRDCRMVEESLEVKSLVTKKFKREKSDDDEIFTIQVRGRERYELLLRVKESIEMWSMLPQTHIDQYRASCPPCGPNWFLEQQKQQQQQQRPLDSQNSSSTDSETENLTPPIDSQLSRTSSNASQGSATGAEVEVSAVRFSLKRTVSLNRKGFSQPKSVDCNQKSSSQS